MRSTHRLLLLVTPATNHCRNRISDGRRRFDIATYFGIAARRGIPVCRDTAPHCLLASCLVGRSFSSDIRQ